jgi:hypothetical protein
VDWEDKALLRSNLSTVYGDNHQQEDARQLREIEVQIRAIAMEICILHTAVITIKACMWAVGSFI